MQTIHLSGDRKRVLVELFQRANLSDEVFRKALSVAVEIFFDGDKSSVLLCSIKQCPDDEALHLAVLIRFVRSM
ncbi:MAG: hypothetical protein M2R45_02907 [Verrucomicrobia subdivision 3 bacterium]|nr:hypothetical protein [Limisphaerales bacterium]MCS1415371.1 hypothetical protein [Limisphaerales bacterium]